MNNNNSFIYKATNTITNKSYIGQSTVSLKDKQYSHKMHSSYETTAHLKLYVAMNEYGYSNFTWEIIEHVDKSDLCEREKYWIAHYDTFDNGYNATLGGLGISGYKRTEVDRLRASERIRGTNHHNHKLNEYDILTIRKLLSAGMYQKDVAAMYNVTPGNISHISRRFSWNHLEEIAL